MKAFCACFDDSIVLGGHGLLHVSQHCRFVIPILAADGYAEEENRQREKQKEQSTVIKLSGLMFLVGFILAGLGHRFGWYTLPKWVTLIGAALFLVAYILYAETLRENTYLSRTIEVKEGQRVVDTGLYSVVRHPMYSATLLLFLSMPLVLGSYYSLIVFLAYPLIIAKRIKGEEAFLAKELEGYREYKNKVRYRLIPFVW